MNAMRIGARAWWIIGPVVGLVALVAFGVGALAWYVGTPTFRAQLIAAAEAQTGRDLAVNGRMHVSLWPVVGVSAENVTLSNVPGGAAEHLLAAEEIDFGADLLALLRNELIVRRIRVETASLNLEVDAAGRGNWILAPAQVAPGPRGDTVPAEPSVRVDELRIAGARVQFTDRRSNQTYGVDELFLTTRLAGWSTPAPFEARFVYRSEPATLEGEIGRPGALRTGAETPLSFTADSRFLTASFTGTAAAGAGVIQGEVTAAGPSVRELIRWQGFPFPEGRTLQRFNVSGALNASPQGLAFSNATLEVDALLGRGDFTFETINSRPYLTGRLEVPRLDLNRYLMPDAVAETASTDAPIAAPAALDIAAPAWAEAPIDMAALRALDVNLELTTGPIHVFRTTLDRAVLTMAANQGFVAATLHEAALYGGQLTGRVEIDAREPTVRLANDLALDGVAVERLLGDLFGFDRLSGVGQVRLALTAQGANQAQLVGSLAGRVGLVLNQGALQGLDLGGLSETIGRVMRNELAQADAVTRFSNLSLSFDVDAGRAATTDLYVTVPGMRIGAVGVFDLVQRRVDLRFMPRGRLITTPFVMRGPFAGPLSFESDLRGRLREEFDGLVEGVRGE
jgi:AsmA protein